MWVRPESFGPSCADLLCQGRPLLKPEETPGARGTGHLLPEVKELKGRRAVCSVKSQGKVKEETEERWHVYQPCKPCLGNQVQQAMAYYQPVPTPTCWTPPAVGWAEDGVGLAEAESPELCQRLDVAGDDMTRHRSVPGGASHPGC